MKYDKTQKDYLACPIGYTSEQESSLNCTKCPEKKSTRKEGSKTCEGKHDGVGYGVIFHVALSLSLSSLDLFVCFFVSFSCSGWNQFSFIDYWLIESQFIDWDVVVEQWVYPIQVFGWLFDNVTWNFCLSVKILAIKGCHQEIGSILLKKMRVIFATLDSIKINMVPHSASNARMDSQQLRRDQPPWMTVEVRATKSFSSKAIK